MSRPDRDPTNAGTLREVFEAEQQIKAMLDAESGKANAWRDRCRQDIDDLHRSDLAELEQEQVRQREEAEKTAAQSAAEIVRQARAEAERIERLSEQRLMDVVWRHLVRVLPGSDA